MRQPNNCFHRNTGQDQAGNRFFSMVYDHWGRFIDIVVYPSEIQPVYISESDLAEYLAFESMADTLQAGGE